MIRVNLRDFYPDYYSEDIFAEISEEVMEEMIESRRLEASAQRKKYRYKAQYSLSYGSEAGYVDTSHELTPETILENAQLRNHKGSMPSSFWGCQLIKLHSVKV